MPSRDYTWNSHPFENLVKVVKRNICYCRISDVSMEIAENRNTGLGRALEVEECRCPRGYRGLSCEV